MITVPGRKRWRWIAITLAVLTAATVTTLIATRSRDIPTRPVATVNGEAIPRELFALYAGIARSQELAAKPDTSAAKSTALRRSVSYMVQLQQLRRLGLLKNDAIPYAGDNMARLRVNTSGYGVRDLPDIAVVDQFLANTKETIVGSVYPRAAVRNTLRAGYETRRSDYVRIDQMVVRRIRLNYTPVTRSGRYQLALELRRRAAAGENFLLLASEYDQRYVTDSSFRRPDGSFVLTGKEKLADPAVVQTPKILRAGEISGVVDSADAFVIVRLDSIQKTQLTFAQVETKTYFQYTDQQYAASLQKWIGSAAVRVDDDSYQQFPV